MGNTYTTMRRGRRGGSHGVFGRMVGEKKMWISGFIRARAFQDAQAQLERAYELVYERKPATVTKPDVVEFLMMGEAEAIRRMSAEAGRKR